MWNIYELCYNPSILPYAIVILNSALKEAEIGQIIKLWQKASVRVCIDGGTNDFHYLIHQKAIGIKSLKTPSNENNSRSQLNGETVSQQIAPEPEFHSGIHLPDFISGDFDSIQPEILKFYSELGVTIAPTPDQNATDFTKGVLFLKDYLLEQKIKINHVLVIAGINSDRFDHVIAHLKTLFTIKNIFPHPVIIMSGHTLLWLLLAGSHKIKVPQSLLKNKEYAWCGYAAFGEPVEVSTCGLKWDISKKLVSFEKLLSTSNTYAPDSDGVVVVECSNPLFWFMGWDWHATDPT